MNKRGIYQKRGAGDIKTSFQQYALWGDPALRPGQFIENGGQDDIIRAGEASEFRFHARFSFYVPSREAIEPYIAINENGVPEIENFDKDYYKNDYLFFAGPYAWSKRGKYVFELGPFNINQNFSRVEAIELSSGGNIIYPLNVSEVEIVKEYIVNNRKYFYVFVQDQSIPYTPGEFTAYKIGLKLIPGGN